jgi:hypothetical protein
MSKHSAQTTAYNKMKLSYHMTLQCVTLKDSEKKKGREMQTKMKTYDFGDANKVVIGRNNILSNKWRHLKTRREK